MLAKMLVCSKIELDIEYLKKVHKDNPDFAWEIINFEYYDKGVECLKLWKVTDEECLKWICRALPIKPEVVILIESLPAIVQEEFWQYSNINSLILDEDEQFVEKCILKLVEHKRVYCLVSALTYRPHTNIDLIIKVLKEASQIYPNKDADGLTMLSVSSEEFKMLFKKIYQEKYIDEDEMIYLEVSYMNLFDDEFQPQYLVSKLSGTPEFFVSIVNVIYAQDDGYSGEKTENQQKMASIAYRILDMLRRIPGQTNDSIDSKLFEKWIEECIDIASKCNCINGCMCGIGKILAYSPNDDDDGIWPHKCVRNFFEKNYNERAAREFCLSRYNQRGVHIFSGGDSETEIAEKYFADEKTIQLEYPKTSQILHRIGEKFKIEAVYDRNEEIKGY